MHQLLVEAHGIFVAVLRLAGLVVSGCGILVCRPGIELQGGLLTTGVPEEVLTLVFLKLSS